MDEYNLDESDALLVQRVLAGDRAAFTTLALRSAASVLRLCQRLLGSVHDAEDVRQEALLQAFLGLARLREPAHFGAWLHAIAANLARTVLRQRRVVSLDGIPPEIPVYDLWSRIPPQPDAIVLAREVHKTIMAAIQDLPARQREAVIGFYLEHYHYDELAAILGVPLSTVKGRLFYGRQALRRVLAPLAADVNPNRCLATEDSMQSAVFCDVTLLMVYHHVATGWNVVVLKDATAPRYLPICVGPFEADAIHRALHGDQTERPMTHDLTLRLLQPLHAEIEHVAIDRILDKTYYATIMLRQGAQTYTVDARPSDALALAARTNAPLSVRTTVIDHASLTLPGVSDTSHGVEQATSTNHLQRALDDWVAAAGMPPPHPMGRSSGADARG
jgi:RNA polymerase sigma factor (sigma-70 family)